MPRLIFIHKKRLLEDYTHESVIGDEHRKGVVEGIERQQTSVVRLVHQLVRADPRSRQSLASQVASEELVESHTTTWPVEQLVHISEKYLVSSVTWSWLIVLYKKCRCLVVCKIE